MTSVNGQYEKIIALIATLIRILRTDASYKYENARKRRAYDNIRYIEKHGWKSLVSGFNRNLRNALAHKTYKVDVIRETVDFYDINKTITLTSNRGYRQKCM